MFVVALDSTVCVALSGKKEKDSYFEIYYLESTDNGVTWDGPVKMLHAPDEIDRVNANIVQDGGTIWVGALKSDKTAARDEASHVAVWYREPGDYFTAEIDYTGFGRYLGLTMAVTSFASKHMMFMSSLGERVANNQSEYFHVIYRKDVDCGVGNMWTWQTYSQKRPIVISKWFVPSP